MEIIIKEGDKSASSKLGSSPIEICFNALRGYGISDENVIKSMYAFSSQYVQVKEEKPKK